VKPLVTSRFALEKEAQEKGVQPRHDFMHYLIKASDPETGEKFKPMDLVGEASLLVAAGSDTTSTTISATLFHLIRRPEVLKKLQDEVRGAFDSVDDIKNGSTLINLPYLRAVIDEGLRISPPVPGALHRKVLPGGQVVDGYHIPEGTIIGASIYAVQHNDVYFVNPHEFIPERWIPGSQDLGFPVTESSLELQKQAFFPFSLGPRNCVGKNMAIMELLITMGRMAWLFDIRGLPGDKTGGGSKMLGEGREREDEYQLTDWLICSRKGPVVQFKPREGVVV
jgi:cytochrome P450